MATHFFGGDFFGGDFFGSPRPPVVVIDTHDGERRKRDADFKRARDELRRQIEAAIAATEGTALADALEAIAVPGPAETLAERVGLDALEARPDLLNIVERAVAAYWAAADEDDEEVLWLVMY